MILQVTGVRVPLDDLLPGREADLERTLANALGIASDSLVSFQILRKSVDARKKRDVHFVVNVQVEIAGVGGLEELHPARGVQVLLPSEPALVEPPDLAHLAATQGFVRPLVVGAGPAGLFCTLRLARAGLRPLLVERGRPVEERMRDVRAFAEGGALDPDSNIQFGEGGAGTFSDGKLTTGTKSPYARAILKEFAACGAPEDILVDAHPHIGTDFLPKVVQNLRKRIEAAGGEVRFSTQFAGQRIASDGTIIATLRNLRTGTEEDVTASAVVLAMGHSARDTFALLHDAGMEMERKPFAVGVRIEHPQAMIDQVQYGPFAGHPGLPPAEYKLAMHTEAGRGVYTFCMCPGGSVVAAASEEGSVCVNGMSPHARDGKNANAALLVEVRPEDLPEEDGVLAGITLQRELEQTAFRAAGGTYAAPAQTVGGFLGTDPDASPVAPTYPRGTEEADLHEVLPAFVTEALEEALPVFGRKLAGFDDPSALMTAPEARSSSPARILRHGKTSQSVTHPGIFPAGEGAGYAGGIMSAAADGMRVADGVMEELQARAAAAALVAGKPAVFPTDTVAGVGIAVTAAEDGRVLAQIKGRPADKPIAWLVDGIEALDRYGRDVPAYAFDLAREGWPGPLTLIVRASDAVPPAFRSSQGTIGLRAPASRMAQELIRRAGSPLAATSANLAGDPAPQSVFALSPDFKERARSAGAAFLLAKEAACGQASAVIDCTGALPRILR